MSDLISTGAAAASAVVFCLVLAVLGVFQAALIAGAPLGHFAWGGQDKVLPKGKRIGSATSIILYVAFAAIILQRAGIVSAFAGDAFTDVASWVIAGYLALGIVMNAISRSKPERLTMVPVTVVLAALAFVVALS